MKNDLPLLQSTTLFSGLSAEELQALLTRLWAVESSFGRGEVLVLAGAPSRRVGVVLSGELEAYRPGPESARVPITRVEPGGVFGDVLGGSSLAGPVAVLADLRNERERAGSLTFSIPVSRGQLADYLNCDRSALSRELSLMQKDGLLDTFKSSFKLLDPDALKQMVQ